MDYSVDLSGWYSDSNSSLSSDEILSAAFARAKLLLRSVIKSQDFETLFPPAPSQAVPNNTISDVQKCLQEAQTKYQDRIGFPTECFSNIAPTTTAVVSANQETPLRKARVKARVWLTSLSEKIVYYGNIFDVLVQHHPEYVSLAWGTFKLLFIAIENHAETASKLSRSISQIADLLPQQSLLSILYPTDQMQTSLARLYAHIMEFFISALKWYKESRLVHTIKSILQPWDLKFRKQHDAIAAEAQQITRLAGVALKVEVRDTRLEVIQGTKTLDLIRKDLSDLKIENQRLAGRFEAKFGAMQEVLTSLTCVSNEIRLDLSGQRITLNRVHLTQMLSLPLWSQLPTSGESLGFCRSMRRRRREPTKLLLPDAKKLSAWTLQNTNTLLLIDSYVPAVAKAFMVDLIDLILQSEAPIIWALRFEDYWEQRVTVLDVVRMLVLQTIQVCAGQFLDNPFPLTVEQFRGATSLRDWVAILAHLLSTINNAFIVLDADLLAHATAHDRSEAMEMMDMLRRKISGNIKIITAMSSVSRSYAEDLEQSGKCLRIQTGQPKTWRNARRQRRPGMRLRSTKH